MQFRVGPFTYRLIVTSGDIDFEGEPCLGLCDNESHQMFISDRCRGPQRLQVLCHEYMEAWLYHFGQGIQSGEAPAKEAWCDLFGLAMAQFVGDLLKAVNQNDQVVFADETTADLSRAETDSFDKRAALRQAVSAAMQNDDSRESSPIRVIKRRDHIVRSLSDEDPAWRVRIFEAPSQRRG